jgi:hypothetical protein
VKLTRRGKLVLGLALAALVYVISTKVWWVGDHYCFGSAEKCLKIEGEVKK